MVFLVSVFVIFSILVWQLFFKCRWEKKIEFTVIGLSINGRPIFCQFRQFNWHSKFKTIKLIGEDTKREGKNHRISQYQMNYTCGMSREHNGNHHQTSIPLTAFDHLYSMRHDAFFTVMINSMFFSFHFASSKQTNKQTLMKNKCANFFSTFRNSEIPNV